MIIFYIFLTHLAPFLDNLNCYLFTMLTLILKRINKFKKKQDIDARYWIQIALLNKNFNKTSY